MPGSAVSAAEGPCPEAPPSLSRGETSNVLPRSGRAVAGLWRWGAHLIGLPSSSPGVGRLALCQGSRFNQSQPSLRPQGQGRLGSASPALALSPAVSGPLRRSRLSSAFQLPNCAALLSFSTVFARGLPFQNCLYHCLVRQSRS